MKSSLKISCALTLALLAGGASAAPMRLTLEPGGSFQVRHPEDLAQALRSWGRAPGSVVVLESASGRVLQAAGEQAQRVACLALVARNLVGLANELGATAVGGEPAIAIQAWAAGAGASRTHPDSLWRRAADLGGHPAAPD